MSHTSAKTILQFTPDGAAGGGTTVVLGLVEGLIREGWRVVLLTEESSTCAYKGAELGAEVRTAGFMGKRTDPGHVAAVEGVVAETRPDVIHLHGTRAAYFGRTLKHDKVACTIHGYHFLRKALPGRVAGWLGARASFGAISDLIFVSDYDRRTGERARLVPPKARVHVIHNGVSLPSVPNSPKKPRQIAFPHRMTHPKDPLMALATLAQLKDEGYTMVCAGSGELDGQVHEEARRLALPVRFAGGMSHLETLHLIQESEVMLMTSLWEGFPMTPLEAMAFGTPVVASAVCGIPEMIRNGVDGLLAEPHTPEAYANAIRKLQDHKLVENITSAARDTVRDRFHWNHTFQQHLKVYTS